MVVAGNSSGLNTGAAVVLTYKNAIAKYYMPVMAKIILYSLRGVAPHFIGLGPIPAVNAFLSLDGLHIPQINCI